MFLGITVFAFCPSFLTHLAHGHYMSDEGEITDKDFGAPVAHMSCQNKKKKNINRLSLHRASGFLFIPVANPWTKSCPGRKEFCNEKLPSVLPSGGPFMRVQWNERPWQVGQLTPYRTYERGTEAQQELPCVVTRGTSIPSTASPPR